ncbi:hypothetical protein HNQ88_003736 [Aureibacter tunicatorum]|uniref:NADAR domain-containing protein n=2 Tax=Aureibacter tunicatorum TaxID=866807 RepID=A0AAE3XRL8_9BACT|nr:hypothetical protein [Aureibacter tunicatorum]
MKFLFFWGHQPSRDGSVSSSCFSQWWQQIFEIDNIKYPTAEHWMMAEKARLFGDTEVLERILKAKSPGEAKKLGRLVKGFDQTIWESKRYQIVVLGNYHKFKQHPELMKFLLNTKERVLVEASPVDAIWGIGYDSNHQFANVPVKWRGLNLLGFALMEVRDMLK